MSSKHLTDPDLAYLRKLICKHKQALEVVRADIPEAVNVGLFTVVVSEVRNFLLAKHTTMYEGLLALVARSAHLRATRLQESFTQIFERLGTFPNNIEELVELKDYMATVPGLVRELSRSISKMVAAYDVAEEFWYDPSHHAQVSCTTHFVDVALILRFKVPTNEFMLRWTMYGQPRKVQHLLRKVAFKLKKEKARYHEEMKEQQGRFESLILILHQEVVGFARYEMLTTQIPRCLVQALTLAGFRYNDLAKVEIVASHVAKVKAKLASAEEQSRLFNNREALFQQDITPYANLATVQKLFEPYARTAHVAVEMYQRFARTGTNWCGKPPPTGSDGTRSGSVEFSPSSTQNLWRNGICNV